jgi:hypothetical protein
MRAEFPDFGIVSKKDSKFMKVISFLLMCITFGKSDFDRYHTIIYKTLYSGKNWENLTWLEKYCILRHERIHMRQAARMFFGYYPIGYVIFSFAYLFLLPSVFTLRAYFEKEAYQESLKCYIENKLIYDKNQVIEQFMSAQYFWMFPFRDIVKKWF